MSELKTGAIVLMIKNKDNTLSPILMDKEHASIIQHFLSGLSEDKPLMVLTDKYIKL